MRVHELAKHAGMESKQVKDLLVTIGVEVKSPSSKIKVPPIELAAIKSFLSET